MKGSHPGDPCVTVAVGNITPSSASVIVRTDVDDQRWEGEVIGPFCRYGKTLLGRTPLRWCESPSGRVAAARLVDPCFWSPHFPAYYRLTMRRRPGLAESAAEQLLGIRHLATRRRSLYFDGRRWVMRAVWKADVTSGQLAQFRTHSLGWITSAWNTNLLHEASLDGIPLVIDLTKHELATLAAALQAVSAWPSVIGAILPQQLASGAFLKAWCPNLLAACVSSTGQSIPDWAQLVLLPSSVLVDQRAAEAALGLPCWVASRQEPQGQDPASWRRACEHLQASLAPGWDLAGYCIEA